MPTARIKSTNVVISQSPQHHENEKSVEHGKLPGTDMGYRYRIQT